MSNEIRSSSSNGVRRSGFSLLDCPSCHLSFSLDRKDPRLLDCGHTICLACLLKLFGKTSGGDASRTVPQCPLCRKPVGARSRGAALSLSKNMVMMSYLIKVNHDLPIFTSFSAAVPLSHSSPPPASNSTILCDDGCGRKATMTCEDCKCNLCSVCDSEIHSRHVLRSHRRIPILERHRLSDSLDLRCQKHNTPFTNYCFTCSDLCCSVDAELHSGKGHIVSPLKSAISEILKSISKSYPVLLAQQERGSTIADKLVSCRRELVESSDRVLSDMTRLRDRIIATVNQRHEKFVSVLNVITTDEIASIDEALKQTTEFDETISSLVHLVSECIDSQHFSEPDEASLNAKIGSLSPDLFLSFSKNLLGSICNAISLDLPFAKASPATLAMDADDVNVLQSLATLGNIHVLRYPPLAVELGLLERLVVDTSLNIDSPLPPRHPPSTVSSFHPPSSDPFVSLTSRNVGSVSLSLGSQAVFAWGVISRSPGVDLGTPSVLSPISSLLPTPPPSAGVCDVVCGENFILTLRADKSVWFWGDNSFAQAGIDPEDKMFFEVLEEVPSLSKWGFISLSAGPMHCAGITSKNEIVTWGRNDGQECGHSWQLQMASPQRLDFNIGGAKIQLLRSGQWVLRDNLLFNLRSPSTPEHQQSSLPQDIGIRDIAHGSNGHTLILLEDGKLYAWGNNGRHECSAQPISSLSSPHCITELESQVISGIAVGPSHSLAFCRGTNTLFGWGDNSFGQLGIAGAPDCVPRPAQVTALRGIAIRSLFSTMNEISCIVTTEGKLFYWGKAIREGLSETFDSSSSSLDLNLSKKIVSPTEIPISVGAVSSVRWGVSNVCVGQEFIAGIASVERSSSSVPILDVGGDRNSK